MALREKLRERAGPFLEPGEQVREVFMAQSGPSPLFALVSYWIVIIAGQYVIVVVTDRAVVVLKASKVRPSFPKSALLRLPRLTLGPVSGLWGKVQLGGERYWVNKRFHKDIEAADADLANRPSTTIDAPPSPDLMEPGAPAE
jgi:hypothetical protein